jgi:hypothetical protein
VKKLKVAIICISRNSSPSNQKASLRNRGRFLIVTLASGLKYSRAARTNSAPERKADHKRYHDTIDIPFRSH